MSEKEILSSTAPEAEEVQSLPVANASVLDAGAGAEVEKEVGDGDSAVSVGAENDVDAEGEEDLGGPVAEEDGKVEEDTNMDETDGERKQRACRQSMFITKNFRFLFFFFFLFVSPFVCTGLFSAATILILTRSLYLCLVLRCIQSSSTFRTRTFLMTSTCYYHQSSNVF